MKKLSCQILTVISLSGACWLGSLAVAVAADAKPERRPPGAGAPGAPGDGGVRERMQRIAEELKLSDNQKAEVRSIMQEQGEKMRELREDKDLSQEQKLAKFREWREATGKKINAVLDAEQQKKWAGLRDTFLQAPGGRGGDGAPAAGGGPAGDRIEMLRRVAEELKLTEEQRQRVQPIFREEGEKMRELQADTSLSREEKLAKFQALRTTAAAKFKAILTPEQQAQWETIRPGLQAGPGGAGGAGGAGQDAMQRLADELKLTKEQREKLRPILFEEFTQRQALRKNDKLSREEALAKFKELHAATTAKVKPILSPEQLEKWVKLREDMLARRRDADGK